MGAESRTWTTSSLVAEAATAINGKRKAARGCALFVSPRTFCGRHISRAVLPATDVAYVHRGHLPAVAVGPPHGNKRVSDQCSDACFPAECSIGRTPASRDWLPPWGRGRACAVAQRHPSVRNGADSRDQRKIMLIVLRRASGRDWVRSGREFLGLMVRAGAVVDKIGVVSACFGEGLGQVMGLFGDVSGAVVPGRDPEAVR